MRAILRSYNVPACSEQNLSTASDLGQGDESWVHLANPEAKSCCVIGTPYGSPAFDYSMVPAIGGRFKAPIVITLNNLKYSYPNNRDHCLRWDSQIPLQKLLLSQQPPAV